MEWLPLRASVRRFGPPGDRNRSPGVAPATGSLPDQRTEGGGTSAGPVAGCM